MSSSKDQTLACGDRGQSFTWSAGEQEFFRERGLTNSPKRCRECRKAGGERCAASDRKGGRG